MADDDKLEVNLELPKLFGRKKKTAAEAEQPEPAPENASEPPSATESTAATAEDAAESVGSATEAPPSAQPEADDEMTDTAERAAITDAAAEPGTDEVAAETPADDDAPPAPGAELHEQISDAPPATPVAEPEPAPEPTSAEEPQPEPVPQPPAPETEPEPEPAPETKPVPAPDPSPELSPDADPISQQPAPTGASEAAAPAKPKGPGVLTRMRRSSDSLPRLELPALPTIGGYQAAAITGAVIGLLLVLITAGTMQLCGVIRGTDTCGRAGFFLLAAIFVLMVLASTMVLRAWGIKEPGSTALLAVGMIAVIALLFLIDVLFSWWMVVVIPIIGAMAFALSFWVTDNYAEAPVQDDADIDVT